MAPRRKKRVLTEEQKAAAVERLAKARANRGEPKYSNYHPNVVALPDDARFSLKNVRGWIKNNKEKIGPLKTAVRRNEKGAISQLRDVEGYIRHCEWYLRTGDWIDNFYGMEQEKRITWRTTVPAYDKQGMQKTSWETDRVVRTAK
jgi:hypothetical protein